MPKRPDVRPSVHDREVFVHELPEDMRAEGKLVQWLTKDFGPVDHVFLLRDGLDGPPNGKAYIRFKEHSAAALYIEVEGSTAAAWSESERASQRSRSVYGSDVYAAFFGQDSRILPDLLSQCGVGSLSAQSEVKRPWSQSSPFRQLHFFAECSEHAFRKVRACLCDALQAFHRGCDRYAQAVEQLRAGEGQHGQKRPRPNSAVSLSWDPATGQYVEEDLPAELQELVAKQPPAQAPAEAHGGPGWSKGAGGKGVAMLGQKGVTIAPPRPKQQEGKQQLEMGWPAAPPPEARPAGAREPRLRSLTPAQLEAVARGEEMVQEGRQAAKAGQLARAHLRFRQGLRLLMENMPDTPEDVSQVHEVDRQHLQRIDQYLSEMESLGGGSQEGAVRTIDD